MAGRFTRTAADRGLAQIRYVTPVRQAAARGQVATVYEQVERDFGMLAPPIALHSPAPGPLTAAWVILRETLVADGAVDRATKEAVAAAVSLGNSCPYCVDVHTASMHGLVGGREALTIAAGDLDSLPDRRLREVTAWARASGTAAAAARLRPAVPAGHALELVAVATTFHYFNRMVHVLLPDSPIPVLVPDIARGKLWRLLGRFMWPAARGSHEPGRALGLLSAADLPPDLSWTVELAKAAGSGANIIEGFARAAGAVERAGRSVPPAVRELVLDRLAAWSGQRSGLSRAWVADAVAGLAAAERPAGRLALLTALAAYQVDSSVVTEFADAAGDARDERLVELTSWASLAAARRVGSWLGEQWLHGTTESPAA